MKLRSYPHKVALLVTGLVILENRYKFDECLNLEDEVKEMTAFIANCRSIHKLKSNKVHVDALAEKIMQYGVSKRNIRMRKYLYRLYFNRLEELIPRAQYGTRLINNINVNAYR